MKIAAVTTLPLLASAAVIPNHQTSKPSNGISTAFTGKLYAGLDHVEKRQVWEYVGSQLQTNLPGFLRWFADNVSWALSMQEEPIKKIKLGSTVDQAAQRANYKFGPWLLSGSQEMRRWQAPWQMDPKSTIIVRTLKGLPSNAAITSVRPILEYEDGSPADYAQGIYVHHFLISDMSKPSAPFALCPNMHKEETIGLWTAGYVLEAVGAGLVQAGQDQVGQPNLFKTKSKQIQSAFLTNQDDLFALQAEIVNNNPSNRTVFLNLELEFLENKPQDYLDASTITLSATGCMPPSYRAPSNQKRYNYSSQPFEITQNGYIINTRGHLHDGGSAIELWLNNTMVCRSLPTYSRPAGTSPEIPETILEMSWCHDPIKISKGDQLKVVSHYDVEKHPLRKGTAGAEHSHSHKRQMPAMTLPLDSSAHDNMEGMEEMGIMTTNFAWEIPAEIKNAPTVGSSAWSRINSSNAATEEKKPQQAAANSAESWWSILFGSSPSPVKEETPKSITTPILVIRDNHPAAPQESESSWWSYLGFSGSKSASPSPSPSPTPTQHKITKPGQPIGPKPDVSIIPAVTATTSTGWFEGWRSAPSESPKPFGPPKMAGTQGSEGLEAGEIIEIPESGEATNSAGSPGWDSVVDGTFNNNKPAPSPSPSPSPLAAPWNFFNPAPLAPSPTKVTPSPTSDSSWNLFGGLFGGSSMSATPTPSAKPIPTAIPSPSPTSDGWFAGWFGKPSPSPTPSATSSPSPTSSSAGWFDNWFGGSSKEKEKKRPNPSPTPNSSSGDKGWSWDE